MSWIREEFVNLTRFTLFRVQIWERVSKNHPGKVIDDFVEYSPLQRRVELLFYKTSKPYGFVLLDVTVTKPFLIYTILFQALLFTNYFDYPQSYPQEWIQAPRNIVFNFQVRHLPLNDAFYVRSFFVSSGQLVPSLKQYFLRLSKLCIGC